MTTVTALAQQKSRRFRVISQAVAVIFLLGYFWGFIPLDFDHSGDAWIFRYVFVLWVSLVAWGWVPFVFSQKANNLAVWEHNRQVWTNVLITIFFSPPLGGIKGGREGRRSSARWLLRKRLHETWLSSPKNRVCGCAATLSCVQTLASEKLQRVTEIFRKGLVWTQGRPGYSAELGWTGMRSSNSASWTCSDSGRRSSKSRFKNR